MRDLMAVALYTDDLTYRRGKREDDLKPWCAERERADAGRDDRTRLSRDQINSQA